MAPLRDISFLHRSLTGSISKSPFRQPEDRWEARRHEQLPRRSSLTVGAVPCRADSEALRPRGRSPAHSALQPPDRAGLHPLDSPLHPLSRPFAGRLRHPDGARTAGAPGPQDDDGLHAWVEPRRAGGAQSPRPAAKGALGREPGDYADRGVGIKFRR